MPRKLEQKAELDSFEKAIRGALAVSRTVKKQTDQESILRRLEAKEQRKQFWVVAHDFDRLEHGLQRLEPAIGEFHISTEAIRKAELPLYFKPVLMRMSDAFLDVVDLRVVVHTSRVHDGRNVDIAYQDGAKKELARVSLNISRADYAMHFRYSDMHPDKAVPVARAVQFFEKEIDVKVHGNEARAKSVFTADRLITFLKGQLEHQALDYMAAHGGGVK